MYMMLRKVLRVTEEKAKAQSSYGGRTQHSSLTFPGLYTNNVHLHPMLVAHFLDFITYQRHSTSPNIELQYHCCLLTCSPAGQWFSIKRNTDVFQNLLKVFTGLPPLSAHTQIHLCTNTFFSLETFPVRVSYLFASFPLPPPHFKNHLSRRSSRFSDEPTLFTEKLK